jgi:cytoskeletal protein CcmA (bactofilin family)
MAHLCVNFLIIKGDCSMFHRQNSTEEKNKTEQSVSVNKVKETAVSQPAESTEKKEDRVMSDNQTSENQQVQGAETVSETVPMQQENPMGLYQRSAQTPTPAARVPGAYPGYGNGSAQPTSKNVYGSSDKGSSDRRLVIGPGITMSGEIESCDNLIVEGTVEASLKGASILDITDTGVFYGSVEIEDAVIAGRFEGDITVNGRLTVTSSGSITGTIVYGELAIEAGASIDGRMSPLASAASTSGAEKPKAKVAVSPRNDNVTEEAELPFSGNVAAAS